MKKLLVVVITAVSLLFGSAIAGGPPGVEKPAVEKPERDKEAMMNFDVKDFFDPNLYTPVESAMVMVYDPYANPDNCLGQEGEEIPMGMVVLKPVDNDSFVEVIFVGWQQADKTDSPTMFTVVVKAADPYMITYLRNNDTGEYELMCAMTVSEQVAIIKKRQNKERFKRHDAASLNINGGILS